MIWKSFKHGSIFLNAETYINKAHLRQHPSATGPSPTSLLRLGSIDSFSLEMSSVWLTCWKKNLASAVDISGRIDCWNSMAVDCCVEFQARNHLHNPIDRVTSRAMIMWPSRGKHKDVTIIYSVVCVMCHQGIDSFYTVVAYKNGNERFPFPGK